MVGYGLLENLNGDKTMETQPSSRINDRSATTRRANGALTRRQLMGASVLLGTGLLAATATPLDADDEAEDGSDRRPVIDSHVHLWKLPRNAPPMNDNATFPTGCCGSVPWMEVDRLI